MGLWGPGQARSDFCLVPESLAPVQGLPATQWEGGGGGESGCIKSLYAKQKPHQQFLVDKLEYLLTLG